MRERRSGEVCSFAPREARRGGRLLRGGKRRGQILSAAGGVGKGKKGGALAPLDVIELRPPDVEDQHDAVLGAVVPGFVLDRIVENEKLALRPIAHFVAEPAA